MTFGVCGTMKLAGAAKEAGYAYMEVPVAVLRSKSDPEAELAAIRSAGLGVDAMNCFFPGDVTLYGDEAVRKQVLSYAEENVRLARLAGTKIMVIGSGKARSVPPFLTKEEAFRSLAELVGAIAELASPYGISLAVEPLNVNETNLVNTLADGIRLSRAVGLPNVGCLADFYHVFMNGEPLAAFEELKPGELIHVHIARPDPDRRVPGERDRAVTAAWGQLLRKTGYEGRISLEGRLDAEDPGKDVQNALPELVRAFG